MSDKISSKCKKKYEISYEDLFLMRLGPIIDITNAFVPIVGKEKAYEIVAKLSEEKAVESVKQNISQLKPILDFQDFKKLFKKQMQSDIMKNTTTYTIKEDSDEKLEFHITECLWAKTMSEMKACELGYLVSCKPDFAMAESYHPNIKLIRTKTLMQGNQFCNHTYIWKREKK